MKLMICLFFLNEVKRLAIPVETRSVIASSRNGNLFIGSMNAVCFWRREFPLRGYFLNGFCC
ncbi:hypothetical protein ACE6H2_002323 [Prunus campanulata]